MQCSAVVDGVPERKRLSLAAVVLNVPLLFSHSLSGEKYDDSLVERDDLSFAQ